MAAGGATSAQTYFSTKSACLILCVTLIAGCDQSVSRDKDNPYAPGVSKGGEAVDPIVVAHRLMEAGEYELALENFSRAAVDRGLDAEVLAGLGSANLGLGRLDTAEQLLRQATEVEPNSPQIWNNLGVVLTEKGEYSEAEQVFKRAFALDHGETDSIRDNLRLALAKLENPSYTPELEQEFKLIRRGSSDYLIRSVSG
ncbi:MAG: tetratricopeptide repeat protein [Pseudomonadota bacterium]